MGARGREKTNPFEVKKATRGEWGWKTVAEKQKKYEGVKKGRF